MQQPVYKQTPVYETKYYYTVYKSEPYTDTASENDHNPYWPSGIIPGDINDFNYTEEYYFTITQGVTNETNTFEVKQEAWNNLKQGDIVYLAIASQEEIWLIDNSGNSIAQVTSVK